MAETIESFVSKLKTEGIEQGQRQAEELCSNARSEADKIVNDAQAQADKIISDARKEAETVLTRSKTELELAARDAAMKLRESLTGALQAVITGPIIEQLEDPAFIRNIMTEIIKQYTACDFEGAGFVKISLTPVMHKELAEWAISTIRKSAKKENVHIDLQNTLRQAGFEYNISGATVEMTQESLIETIMGLVGSNLREVYNNTAKTQ